MWIQVIQLGMGPGRVGQAEYGKHFQLISQPKSYVAHFPIEVDEKAVARGGGERLFETFPKKPSILAVFLIPSTHNLVQKGVKMPFGWLRSKRGVCKFGKMALIIDMPTPGPARLPHGADFANGAWLSRWVDMSVGRGGAI